MISKECFVYLQLPDSMETITIGRLRWSKAGSNSEVGTFVYGKSYLKNPTGFPLDPFRLPLEEREFQETLNEGLPGPIRDASPDSWGRYVIQKNTPPDQHTPVGYLLQSAGDRVGALSFGVGKSPPTPNRIFNKTMDLSQLIQAAHKLEKDLPLEPEEKSLLLVGPSAGGARPKTTVQHKGHLWLAKFPSIEDRHNYSKIEYITMLLAKHCGLRVPPMELISVGNQDVFLIQRFDRTPTNLPGEYFRHHFVSGLTLLNLDEKDHGSWSYLDLADQMRRWIASPSRDLKELFKRIIFNGLVSNTDDHPRNHGFLWNGKSYGLSPVYDLVPKPEIGTTRSLAMPFGVEGRSFRLSNLLSKIDSFGLTQQETLHLFLEFKAQIADWRNFYKKHGLSNHDLTFLEGAFSHWGELENSD